MEAFSKAWIISSGDGGRGRGRGGVGDTCFWIRGTGYPREVKALVMLQV